MRKELFVTTKHGMYAEAGRAAKPKNSVIEWFLSPSMSVQWWDILETYTEIGLKLRWGIWYVEVGFVVKR